MSVELGGLPNSWCWVSLKDVLSEPLVNGRSVKTMEGGFPVLRLTAIKGGKIMLSESKEGAWSLEQAAPFLVREGDFLLSRGNGSKRLVGRGGLVGAVVKPVAFPDTMIRVRVNDELISTSYLRLLWDSPVVRGQIESKARTTAGIYKVNQVILEGVSLPLPPLAEQHRIVEALEEQLSRLEGASASLRSSAERSASLRRSLVARAFSGKLLAEQSSNMSARPLLEQVDAQVSAHAAKKRRSQERTPAEEWRHDLPDGWEWRTLGSLSLLIQYGTSAKAEASAVTGAVPVIRMGNIQSGKIVMHDVKYLSGDHPDIEPTRLRDGDLLFNRTNSAELVGKSAVYRNGLGEAVFASYLIRCRLAVGIDPDWVSAYVNSSGGRKYIGSTLSQQVGQANVNSAKLAMFPIPVPPEEEQKKIMENLREWYRLLGHSDQGTRSASLRSAGLRQALLRAAFAGRLTRQSLDDEPASELLARIAAERVPSLNRARKAPVKRPTTPAQRTAEAAAFAPEPTPAPALAVQQEFDL